MVHKNDISINTNSLSSRVPLFFHSKTISSKFREKKKQINPRCDIIGELAFDSDQFTEGIKHANKQMENKVKIIRNPIRFPHFRYGKLKYAWVPFPVT